MAAQTTPHPPQFSGSFSTDVSQPALPGHLAKPGLHMMLQTPPLHDYQLVNGRFGVRKGGVELSGYVNNIGNVTYVSFEAAASRRFSQPRTYGVQLRYNW